MTKDEIFLLRRSKKITLKEVSTHLRCSISLISRYERDERKLNKAMEESYISYIQNK